MDNFDDPDYWRALGEALLEDDLLEVAAAVLPPIPQNHRPSSGPSRIEQAVNLSHEAQDRPLSDDPKGDQHAAEEDHNGDQQGATEEEYYGDQQGDVKVGFIYFLQTTQTQTHTHRHRHTDSLVVRPGGSPP